MTFCTVSNLHSTPLLRTTKEAQNPSELEAVVSCCDDCIKWEIIEVSWWVTADYE
jgi:hypothetical protein